MKKKKRERKGKGRSESRFIQKLKTFFSLVYTTRKTKAKNKNKVKVYKTTKQAKNKTEIINEETPKLVFRAQHMKYCRNAVSVTGKRRKKKEERPQKKKMAASRER